MKQIFFLSGEHIDLAREEVLALTKPKNNDFHHINRILIVEHDKKQLENRLAYTHAIYDFLFQATPQKLSMDIRAFGWKKIYKKDFCTRLVNFSSEKNLKYDEKQLGSQVWHQLARQKVKPKVNLSNSKTEINFFIFDRRIYCGLLKSSIVKDFKDRRPHLRPVLHPTSMHPKLARCCINLTGIEDGKKKKSGRKENAKTTKIADLMCGTGGILIELGLMDFPSIGVDIDKNMLWKARVNLDYFGIEEKDCKLIQGDATKFKGQLDYVVTDLPYGKNTRKAEKSELEKFYLAFLLNLRKLLQKKAVIIFPSFSSHTLLLKKSGFRLEREFTIYIHASLSRKICVIS